MLRFVISMTAMATFFVTGVLMVLSVDPYHPLRFVLLMVAWFFTGFLMWLSLWRLFKSGERRVNG